MNETNTQTLETPPGSSPDMETPPSPQTTSAPKCRKVRFNNDDSSTPTIILCGYVPLRTEMTPSEHRALWWVDDDFENIINSAQSACRGKSQSAKNLRKAFEECSAKAPNRVLGNRRRASGAHESEDGHRGAAALLEWCQQEQVRGLERWCNDDLTRERDREQNKLIMDVLHKFNEMDESELDETNRAELDEAIRIISENHSRRAKEFALAMAWADARVASHTDTEEGNNGGGGRQRNRLGELLSRMKILRMFKAKHKEEHMQSRKNT
mmetsp:Transcript_44839/g.54266  ORF Transcript_44839/g.54266 Transcript_44839/m.54266 type:complete len:268 (-) Transcript_44839:169-972(-)